MKTLSGILAVCLALTGCTTSGEGAGPEQITLVTQPGEGPPDAKPGACYGKDVTPATVEVVTEQVMIQPAQIASDGAVIQPAIYRTSTHQAIVKERQEFFFEVPCANIMTPEFIASLQRALKARRLFRGQITGVMDAKTRKSVRQFQAPAGLDSGILTMETARKLGLIAYLRPPAGE